MNFQKKSASLKQNEGQSIIQFLAVLPIMLAVVFWSARIYEEFDMAQKTSSLLWFGMRQVSFDSDNRLMTDEQIQSVMSSVIGKGIKVEYQNEKAKRSDDPNMGSTNTNLAAISAVLNPTDASVLRRATVIVEYSPIFPRIPFLNEKTPIDKITFKRSGYLWISETTYESNPNPEAYCYALKKADNKQECKADSESEYQKFKKCLRPDGSIDPNCDTSGSRNAKKNALDKLKAQLAIAQAQNAKTEQALSGIISDQSVLDNFYIQRQKLDQDALNVQAAANNLKNGVGTQAQFNAAEQALTTQTAIYNSAKNNLQNYLPTQDKKTIDTFNADLSAYEYTQLNVDTIQYQIDTFNNSGIFNS